MYLLIIAYTAFTVKIALRGTDFGKHHSPQYLRNETEPYKNYLYIYLISL